MNRLQVPRHRRLLLSSNVLFLASLLGCGSDAGHPSVVPSPSASPTAAPIPSPSGSIIYFVPTPIESSVAKLPTCAGSAREMSLCPNRHASVQSNHRPVPRAVVPSGCDRSKTSSTRYDRNPRTTSRFQARPSTFSLPLDRWCSQRTDGNGQGHVHVHGEADRGRITAESRRRRVGTSRVARPPALEIAARTGCRWPTAWSGSRRSSR